MTAPVLPWPHLLVDCPLAAAPVPPRHCWWCAAPLGPRRRYWCTDEHAAAAARDHVWQLARNAAIARDGIRCVRCDWSPAEERSRRQAWLALMALWVPPYPHRRGIYFEASPDGDLARQWHAAEGMAYGVGGLEVNHITPCLGQHSRPSCAHHVDGLETLCEPCHVATTAEQRAAGLLRR